MLSYSVRHQIFVSSTFTDLVEERAEVIQAIWELDCIPTGMEAFVATSESQWDVIQKVIDESDYYVLIIGGRYGSLTDEGISYTEKEFRYAKKRQIPVLAFTHKDPTSIPVAKSEKASDLQAKLEAFRENVMREFPVRQWSSPLELGSIVSRSISREVKVNSRPGWIRNDGSSPIVLLEQINALSEENRILREKLSVQDNSETDSNLESGDDLVTIFGHRKITNPNTMKVQDDSWETEVSWDDIFRDIGPSLINETTEDDLKDTIARFHSFDEIPNGFRLRSYGLNLESWNEIIIQFRALGYMAPGTKKRGVNDRGSYWAITPRGDKKLVSLLAKRRRLQSEAAKSA
ncbi:DUF4062 domain-containing protein [Sphingomonas sp. Leaf23]|uniref:DUF4062 domain-containing protein n=1 Tax=Sphingomonas sp. Leaf23 TaxID=1735689 RepID=UPI001F1FDE12|nr:DUF4062 domain-containing protein [Sphingomonas sp. Leaf23]